MNNPPDTVSHSADNRLPYVLPIGETATHGRKATPTGDEKRQNAALPVHNIPAPEADQAKYLQIPWRNYGCIQKNGMWQR